jgi:hypothetical protein
MKLLFSLLVSLSLAGCTPELNWRIHREPDSNWQASFPAKPVTVKRTITVSDAPNAKFELQLWAANVNEVRYTIGQARWLGAPNDPANLERLAKYLETAMLNNIAAGEKSFDSTGVSTAISTRGEVNSRPLLKAVGTILLDPKKGPIDARLWIQTHIRSTDVVEAIVLGPAESFSTEAAEQFTSSFKPRL